MWVWLLAGAYLLGSIPFGLLIGWSRGVDVRQHGSTNIGATNVGRVVGRRWGLLCLMCDVLKGAVPALAAFALVLEPRTNTSNVFAYGAIGLAAVIGHTFPIFLFFRGGKGVATTVGAALGTFPYFTYAMLIALLGYAVIRKALGYVSVGSLTIAVVFPAAVLLQAALIDENLAVAWPAVLIAFALGLLIAARHSGNISRLVRGDEKGIERDDPLPESAPQSAADEV